MFLNVSTYLKLLITKLLSICHQLASRADFLTFTSSIRSKEQNSFADQILVDVFEYFLSVLLVLRLLRA